MGLCGAKHNVHGSEGDDVERQLQQAEIDSLTDWKVLLLGIISFFFDTNLCFCLSITNIPSKKKGAGESGKSTVVKQIRDRKSVV